MFGFCQGKDILFESNKNVDSHNECLKLCVACVIDSLTHNIVYNYITMYFR